MNVMLATVTERTREIGIRRALGATRTHIVTQFLSETAVLSICGGLLGVGLGLLIPSWVTALSDNVTIVRPGHVLLAFGISVGVGVSFGLYPALAGGAHGSDRGPASRVSFADPALSGLRPSAQDSTLLRKAAKA